MLRSSRRSVRSRRSNRSTASLRSKRFRLRQVPSVPKFHLFQSSRSSPATKNQERSRIGGVKRVPQFMIDRISDAEGNNGVKIFAFSLMPNHFHFVIEASHHQSLSRFMQWLLTSHVRRYHKHYGSSGHVWQGRFKSFPVQRDEQIKP
jgi:Transposase IS200 like